MLRIITQIVKSNFEINVVSLGKIIQGNLYSTENKKNEIRGQRPDRDNKRTQQRT